MKILLAKVVSWIVGMAILLAAGVAAATDKPNILVIFGDDIGIVLDKLDELSIADNTIVVYSTDNGAQKFTWPDGGTIPFRGEKGTTWEGGFRVPAAVRWPGTVEPGTVINDIFSHEDWVPTLMAAAGDPDIKDKLKKGGHKAAGKSFRTHLDGYDQTLVKVGHELGNQRSGSESNHLLIIRFANAYCVTSGSTSRSGVPTEPDGGLTFRYDDRVGAISTV